MQLHNFIAEELTGAKNALFSAYENVPNERRAASPGGQARSPLNMLAEIALMNTGAIEIIETRKMDYPVEEFFARLTAMEAAGEQAILQAIDAGTEKLIAFLREMPEEDLRETIQFPWGPMTAAQVANYTFWNMKYHEGQIYLISTLAA